MDCYAPCTGSDRLYVLLTDKGCLNEAELLKWLKDEAVRKPEGFDPVTIECFDIYGPYPLIFNGKLKGHKSHQGSSGSVDVFFEGYEQFDDITMLAFRPDRF